ncbi:CHAD domain-containing protein [Acetobacterium wieringae]|uniref:CHAD domain-containing protein n=1 Tax=Acetobacterium wieringae TaxID=52694 RepID=UPI0020349F2E|nr:CHAD domain-containing protein [Acetobacterium wieringae]URN85111.1 CHAD domain-containing protein [Acetobacterium wieringae]
MMMEKLSQLLHENQGRYDKGLRLPQIPPIKSVRVVGQSSLDIKAKKKLVPAAEIIMNSGFDEIINAYDYFLKNPSDPEGVHQVRVRIRRFRAILAFFAPIFKAENYQRQQDALRELAGQFGEVRQLDVLLEGIDVIEKENTLKINCFGKIKSFLLEKREAAFDYLLAELKTDDFALKLLDIWIWKFNEPWDETAPDSRGSIKNYSEKQIANWHKKIRRSMKTLEINDQQAIHRVRIKSKKLRYVIEQLSSILDQKTRKSMNAFEKMQDDLGYYHDVFANQLLLEQLVLASDDNQLHYQAGIIIGWQMMSGNRKIKKLSELVGTVV